MRLTGVCMVSMDQYHAFRDQHLLQLGIRLSYLTVVSRGPCSRFVRCAARHQGGDSSIIDCFWSNDRKEVFLGFYIGWYSTIRHVHCKISPRISSRMVINSGKNLSLHNGCCWVFGIRQDCFRSWPSMMHYTDISEAYKCLDSIRGPRSCLSRPTSTPTWHQIELFDCDK